MKLCCFKPTTLTTSDRSRPDFHFAHLVLVVVVVCAPAWGVQGTELSTNALGSPSSATERPAPASAASIGGVSSGVDSSIPIEFDLPPGSLSEVLRQFGQQTGLQLLYEQSAVADKQVGGYTRTATPAEALKEILAGTGLNWQFINGKYLAIGGRATVAPTPTSFEPIKPVVATDNDVTVLADVDVTGQSPWWSSSGSDSVFGFPKPLLETPRTVSYVNGDAIDVFSLSAAEDLLRVVPGVYTTTRFGVQGSVDIRNIPADTYFRGMRRLTLQGHGRSVLAAMDSIEVVGGPASPLHGIGKMGGYVNMVPKSGRSRTGQYLDKSHGFVQLIGGEYNRREVSFGVGGPLSLPIYDKAGGYYVYGLLEDSDSYTEGVPVKQKLFQAATSLDNMVGPFRLETGVNFQESRTAGALIGRLTQELVDNRTYIGGSPLVNLDLNGNGSIGYLEMHTASPVAGMLSAQNQPLNQAFPWPTDAEGKPLPIDQFPKISGIPQTLYDYLVANPEADPTGLLRAQGVGGPLPTSGQVPVGMALDPRTVSINRLNPRRSAAFEKDLKAEFLTFFADLVYDQNPNFTVKNQLFFDGMDQYKNSNQPFSQLQDVYVIEDKLTFTQRLNNLPSWLRINQALSFNVRKTMSKGKRITGDYGNHRSDATSANWNSETGGMTPNTTFTSSNENADPANDGMPWGSIYRTEFSEFGVGTLFDIDIFANTNVLAGARYDGSQAKNTHYAGRYFVNTGTAESPGAYATMDDSAEAWDHGGSWSVSVSQQLPHGLRPYATLAEARVLLDGNNNSLLNTVITAGHIGNSRLKEVGVKGSWLEGRLNLTATAFEQGRTDVTDTDEPNVINAYATATTTRGWQTELKWAPRRNLLLSFYALRQTTRYTPNIGAQVQLDARALGFVDVFDADGNLIYPAEAFLYGGRGAILLPAGLPEYERKQGNPQQQMGLTAVYQFSKHWGATLKGNYLSSTCAGRLCTVVLPESLVFDTGLFWNSAKLDIKLDIANITDELHFRARTGDTLGDSVAQAMLGRRFQVSATYKF